MTCGKIAFQTLKDTTVVFLASTINGMFISMFISQCFICEMNMEMYILSINRVACNRVGVAFNICNADLLHI